MVIEILTNYVLETVVFQRENSANNNTCRLLKLLLYYIIYIIS